jgi:acetyltransferase-like isoleucine patch superfamily enzyme
MMNIKNLVLAAFRKYYTWRLSCAKNISVCKGTRIDLRTKIIVQGGLCLGKNVYLRSREKGYHAGMPFYTTLLADANNAMIEIGDNTRVNGAYIHAQKHIKIGNNCVIASGVNIIDSNGHQLYSSDRTKGRDEAKEIAIGNNVWVGLNAIILKDTVIGDNSVVAAGSVVKGNFPANSLIQGNPAVTVKTI